MDLERLKRRVLYNCDVTDARHAGIYSVCGLVMRLRDLYKWERRLPPWREDASEKVLEWIGEKEDCWEGLMEAGYHPLPVNGHSVDMFDTAVVNQALKENGFFYGAGYAHSLKPTFFLAEIEDQRTIDGKTVWILGREIARDLLTLPAFTQDGQVVLRSEAGRMFLWDQIVYMSNSGRRALDAALAACSIPDSAPDTIRDHFDALWEVQKDLYIRHEIGELDETVFDRHVWQAMLADYPHSAVELYIRTLKDLLADTGDTGALSHVIRRRDAAGLGLYLAFGNGITRMLTKPLICAFDAFAKDSEWERMADGAKAVREDLASQTLRVVEIYEQGRTNKTIERAGNTIKEMMQQAGLIRK